MGLSYSDFLNMDIRQFSNYLDGYIDRREQSLNDNQDLIPALSAKISMAVWGSRKFNHPLKKIRLRGETRAAKLAQALNALGMTKASLDAYMKRKEKELNG